MVHGRMAALAAAIAAAGMASAAPARAEDFSLRDLDKQAHVAVSYSLAFTGAVVLRRYEVPRWQAALIAAGATLALGTTKELLFDDRYSWGDQAANALGVSASAVILFSFEL